MTVQFEPSRLSGTIKAVPSKSASHRAIICAALAEGRSVVKNLIFSNDIRATIDCMTAMGAVITCGANYAEVNGISAAKRPSGAVALPCSESGSTLRFLIPVAAALGKTAIFTGEGRLPARPITPYLDSLTEKGVQFDYQNTMPIELSGQLHGGRFTIPGNISSQFITGLLFALPLLLEDSVIEVTGVFESKPYVHMTLSMLRQFGVQATLEESCISVPGGQRYRATDITVEGDFSQAAFFLTAGAFTGPVTVSGLDYRNSPQGDKAIVDILIHTGANVQVFPDAVQVSPASGSLKPFRADARDIPDLVPILAVLAAQCERTSEIHHAERLRIKESDRLAAISAVLNRAGSSVEPTADGLKIHGKTRFEPCEADSANDHRIAMAAAVAASAASGPIRLTCAESVNKSYPAFYEDYQSLGGCCHVVDLEPNA